MGKLATATITSAIIFASAIPAFAVDATPSTARRETVKQKVEDRKEKIIEKVETRKEDMALRETALKAKLAKFKDREKAGRVETIDKTLANVNKNRTGQMTRFLNNTSLILTKLETRVNQAGANGKDISRANIAITEARAMITSANEAVSLQSTKSYTITVTSESKVGADAKVARDQLQADLKAVLDTVKSAKKAVGNAIEISANTLGETK